MFETCEQFSEEEKKKLSPFVTNCDQTIFVLRNLPEVIKGALFSRYSRSNLGLRELLLREFIQSETSSFQEITGITADSTVQEKAIRKAEEFYNRVLDGYGDDSIGELGGAHLALENVSMVASKLIEDARIGGSPLEKSTRYIFFDKKVNGDYRFFKDPKIMASAHKELYLKVCRHLFETYSELMAPVRQYVESVMPRQEGVSEQAYKASLQARVCDALRGLLPASTLTNIGLYGNGRFFEYLIQKLLVSDLLELNGIGRLAQEELSKVIPSFVRRGKEGHKHFEAWKEFYKMQRAFLARKAENLSSPVSKPLGEVSLIHKDKEAVHKVLSALFFEFSAEDLNGLYGKVAEFPEEKKSEIFNTLAEMRGNRRHKPPRAFEQAEFVFDLTGDFGMFRDLHRHRILTQERQLLSTRLGYAVPPDIQGAGVEEAYHKAMKQAAEAYELLVKEFPCEAQYVVPMNYRIRWYFKINLRSLLWLCELRSAPQGHENYRRMAQLMARAVMEAFPHFAPLFKFVDFNAYTLGRLTQEVRKEQKSNQGDQKK